MTNGGPNILLTGIPRSGTTLVTALMNELPNVVTLNEPRWQVDWLYGLAQPPAPADAVKWLVGDTALLRLKLLQGKEVLDRRAPDGKAVTNYYRRNPNDKTHARPFEMQRLPVPAVADFTLAVKHNVPYINLLPHLLDSGFFDRIVAIVRHPIGVISSWREVPIPLREGDLPAGRRFWPEMQELLDKPMPLLEKQVRILDLLCQRLLEHRNRLILLKYEELVGNVGLLYDHFSPGFTPRNITIAPRDNRFYGQDTDEIRNALLRHGKYLFGFYSEQEIRAAAG